MTPLIWLRGLCGEGSRGDRTLRPSTLILMVNSDMQRLSFIMKWTLRSAICTEFTNLSESVRREGSPREAKQNIVRKTGVLSPSSSRQATHRVAGRVKPSSNPIPWPTQHFFLGTILSTNCHRIDAHCDAMTSHTIVCAVSEKSNGSQDLNVGKTLRQDKFKIRDGNDHRNDIITHWACATREILFRIMQGLDLETGIDAKG